MWGTLEGSLVNLQLDNAIAPLGEVVNLRDLDRVTFCTFVPPLRI